MTAASQTQDRLKSTKPTFCQLLSPTVNAYVDTFVQYVSPKPFPERRVLWRK